MRRAGNIHQHRIWLLLLFGVVSIATSGGWGVIETSEARYAEISREMFVSHDWTHPTLMGLYHYHKPPLTYWVTSAGYFLFGTNPFGARFFLQVSLLVQLVLLYRIVKLILTDGNVAFTACAIYGSMNLVLASMRGLTTDCYLNTFVLLSIWTWLKWRSEGHPGWLYATSVAFALGFLTKGPLIFIVPLSFILGFHGVSPAPPPISKHHGLALLVFALTGLSWYGLLISENRELFSYFLGHQTYDRLVHASVFSRSKPLWYYAAYLPLLLLPWSAIFMASLSRQASSHPVIRRINIFWICLPLVFFSLASSKLVLYVLPVCAGVAISVAHSVHSFKSRYQEWLVLTIFLAEWLALLLLRWIDSSFIIVTPLTVISASSIVLLLLVRRTVRRFAHEERIALYAIISTISLLIYANLFMHRNELRVNSTAPVSHWLRENSLNGKKVIVYNVLLPSIAFQSGKDVLTINAGDRHLLREVRFQRDGRWKDQLLNLQGPGGGDSLRPLLQTPSIVIVKSKFKEADQWIAAYFQNSHTEGKWKIYY